MATCCFNLHVRSEVIPMITLTISIDAGNSSQQDIRDYMEELASSINIKNIMGDYKSFWQLKDYKITNGEDTLIHIYPDYNL